MAGLSGRSGIIILSCFLGICTNDAAVSRTRKGTIKGGNYIAPDNQFSLPVPSNAKGRRQGESHSAIPFLPAGLLSSPIIY
jgi:DNA transposition AAA+ family ATPase